MKLRIIILYVTEKVGPEKILLVIRWGGGMIR